MDVALQIVSIIVSILMIILIMLQVKGGGLGSLLGGDAGGGITRTRRGLEKTLFQITIGLSITFLAVCVMSVIVSR
ncbi:MAG: preprotein translocase subunit SecG [Burkholderiales bacterium]|nr:preprotein translocase subunit SecG [Anaerolineae bacterium]